MDSARRMCARSASSRRSNSALRQCVGSTPARKRVLLRTGQKLFAYCFHASIEFCAASFDAVDNCTTQLGPQHRREDIAIVSRESTLHGLRNANILIPRERAATQLIPDSWVLWVRYAGVRVENGAAAVGHHAVRERLHAAWVGGANPAVVFGPLLRVAANGGIRCVPIQETLPGRARTGRVCRRRNAARSVRKLARARRTRAAHRHGGAAPRAASTRVLSLGTAAAVKTYQQSKAESAPGHGGSIAQQLARAASRLGAAQ